MQALKCFLGTLWSQTNESSIQRKEFTSSLFIFSLAVGHKWGTCFLESVLILIQKDCNRFFVFWIVDLHPQNAVKNLKLDF